MDLAQLNRTESNIDCPEDTLSFTCSIRSNYDALHLVWHVIFPGNNIVLYKRYDGTSVFNSTDILGMNISTTLVAYEFGSYIKSHITLTVLRSFNIDGTQLQCGTTGFDFQNNITIDVNSASTYNYRLVIMLIDMHNNDSEGKNQLQLALYISSKTRVF